MRKETKARKTHRQKNGENFVTLVEDKNKIISWRTVDQDGNATGSLRSPKKYIRCALWSQNGLQVTYKDVLHHVKNVNGELVWASDPDDLVDKTKTLDWPVDPESTPGDQVIGFLV